MSLMYSCRKVAELLLQAQDEPLTLMQQAQLKMHLIGCGDCTNFSNQLKSIRSLVDDTYFLDELATDDTPAKPAKAE